MFLVLCASLLDAGYEILDSRYWISLARRSVAEIPPLLGGAPCGRKKHEQTEVKVERRVTDDSVEDSTLTLALTYVFLNLSLDLSLIKAMIRV